MPIQTKKILGFTMIEILVVMAIMAILAAIGIGAFGGVQSKARDAKRKNDLANMARAMEMYYNDHGEYPDADATGKIKNADGSIASWGGIFKDGNATYMEKLPSDSKYAFFYQRVRQGGTGTGKIYGYRIFTRLENTEDGAVPRAVNGDLQIYANTSNSWTSPQLTTASCTLGCNYYIKQTNNPNPAYNIAPSVIDDPSN